MVDLRKTRTIALLAAVLMGNSAPFAYAMETDPKSEERKRVPLSKLPFIDIRVDPETSARPLSLVVSVKEKQDDDFHALSSDEGKKMIELLSHSHSFLAEKEGMKIAQTSPFKLKVNDTNALLFKAKAKEEDDDYNLLSSDQANERLKTMLGVYTKAFEQEEEEASKQKALEIEQARLAEIERQRLLREEEERQIAAEQAEQQRKFEQEKAELEAAIAKQKEENLKKQQEQEIAHLKAQLAATQAAAEAERERLRQETLQIEEKTKLQIALLEQNKRDIEEAKQKAIAAQKKAEEDAAKQKAAADAAIAAQKKAAEEAAKQKAEAEAKKKAAETTHQVQATLTTALGTPLATTITGGRSDKRIKKNFRRTFQIKK